MFSQRKAEGKLREEQRLFYIKKLKFEIDLERKRAYLRLRYRLVDASFAGVIIKMILLLLSLVFGFDFISRETNTEEKMDVVEFTYNPDRISDFVHKIDIVPTSPMVKTIEGWYKKLFDKSEVTDAEFEALM